MVKFKGFDWSELSERWGCHKDDDDECLEATKDYASKTLGDSKLMAKCAKDIREFLKLLAKDCRKYGYEAPIWEGLLKLKKHRRDDNDDYVNEVLIKYTIELLGCMWS